MKYLIALLLLLSFSTGIFQIVVLGDYTARFGRTFHMQEDDDKIDDILNARIAVLRFMDSL